jgi:NitT/TauT family transport system ATP-binding protein
MPNRSWRREYTGYSKDICETEDPKRAPKGEKYLNEVVKADHITKRYHTVGGEIEVIRDLTFSVYEGEFLAIVGPSGCGKTTVLSLIAGLIAPSSGQVLIDGEPVEGHHDKVGYMLQRDHLFEWRTIEENVLLGLQVKRICNRQTRQKALDLLGKYGLGDFKAYHPHQLSGGMRQKVALIRTLAVDPEILLLDEPFSSLDYQTRLVLSGEIVDIIRREKKTAVLVTHDLAEAISMADRVLVLSPRPASIKAEVRIELGDENTTPLMKRKNPAFQKYFDYLWKELSVHAEQT